jgi:hypothetical protein
MRDIEIIAKALLDARAELTRDRNWPPIEADETVKRLNRILNHPDVKAAQDRMAQGFGQLRVIN